MLKVGITGGIGTGKSVVCKIFNKFGIPSLDADQVAKQILAEDESVRSQLIALFGPEAYIDGMYNRTWITQQVFNQSDLLQQLNQIVHPPTIQYMEDWFTMQKSGKHPYALKEAAIMIESGSYKDMDLLIGVQAPMDLRIERIIKRNQWTREEIERRIASQMSEEERSEYYQFTIVNDEKQSLIQQVEAIHQQILNY